MKLKIFSTRLKSGKGGISTALVGYIDDFSRRKLSYEIVETHSDDSKVRQFFRSLKAALNTNKTDICWFHCGPWFSMLRKLLFISLCKLKGGIIITHLHSPKVYDYLFKRHFKLILDMIVECSDKIVVVAPWWQGILSEVYPDCSQKFVVSLNPIDKQLELLAKKNLAIPTGINKTAKVRILSLSRLVKGKGVDKTILAMKNLPDKYILDIAGSGPQEQYLRNLVSLHNLNSRVNFLGWVDYEDKIKLLKMSSLFCLPSKLDSFGMVYIEALSANLPVVALNFQAIPDVVPAELGILCDNDDEWTLSNAIIKASKMGPINGADFVLNTYSAEKIVRDFLSNINYDS